jgi:DNA-directed RNA polymerase subunit alpha
MEPDVKLQMEFHHKGADMFPLMKTNPLIRIWAYCSIDSIYTPIKNVKFSVENYRVEQKTDYEKLHH